MTEWYRRQTWTKTDEEEFFAKLGRARKDGRAQYLKIQSIELVATKNKDLLTVAETLLKKMLAEYPDDNFNKGSALHTLGDICKLTDNFDDAIDYYKQAIDFEEVYPNVQTNAYLDYSELIVKTGTINQYEFVEKILLEKIQTLLFPVTKYKSYSILAVISNYRNKPDQARKYADLADQNANAETSGLRYHKYLGVVKERDSWLDKLIKRD
jgi:tetratricopeptide (TPR) repeat protein